MQLMIRDMHNDRKFALLAVALVLALAGCGGTLDGTAVAADNDRGVALMGRYEYAAAREVFAAVVDGAPDWFDARVNLAIATLNRQDEGDERRALDILAQVLEREPGHLRALYTSAVLHLYLGEAAPATGYLRQVVAADPQDAYAAYFLGQALLQEGDYAGAAEQFLASVALDPYLRSGYWAGSQALRRVDRVEEATALLEDYQRFAANPAARLAGFSYARMGPKAKALTVSPVEPAPVAMPQGALFAPIAVLDASSGATLTSADLNADGAPDLILTGDAASIVVTADPEGGYARIDHPLSTAGAMEAVLWGDIDDDGLLDVVHCGPTTRYWRQVSAGQWAASGGLDDLPCSAGAVFDADHDGDLDIFITGSAGSELFSNNRDGTFRRLGAEMGLAQRAGRAVLVADLDSDRDLDIAVLHAEPPHDIWENDRTWAYRPFEGLDDLRSAPIQAIAAADADADGHRELFALATGELRRWRYDGIAWTATTVLAEDALAATAAADAAEIDVADFNGDGRLELLVAGPGGIAVASPEDAAILAQEAVPGLQSAIAFAADPASGPAVAMATEEGIAILPPGPGRLPSLSIVPTGRREAEQMRSNGSGIGTRLAVRAGGRWTVLDALDPHSGPGQSLQPLSVGLAGGQQADFVALEWSDGVAQTEIELAAGQRHDIAETERQLASCPVFFVWDGARYRFVSDVLGGAALGYLTAPGTYSPPRPVESYLLGGDMLAARDGHYHVKLAEPMEETAYLDAARLTVYDLPQGWDMVLDERLAVGGAPASGRPIYFRNDRLPVRATAKDGTEVTALVIAKDQRAPPPGARDRRFIGLLDEQQQLTMEFDVLPSRGAVLVADGWIEFPYSQTVFAAWQADARYEAPTVEARTASGDWQTLAAEFGYPAGMPRTIALPLPDLPAGTTALRLKSNMEIYWDRLRVVAEETSPGALATTLAPAAARVARTGFAKRTTGPQRLPHYDYDARAPYWDAKVQRGFYTALGDALELARERDGALAIIGSGEEVHLEFPAMDEPKPGQRRYFAVRFHGWAKDMDLYTRDGDTVAPLPVPADADPTMLARRDALHARYNVRSGGF